jgi:hypothetical protein
MSLSSHNPDDIDPFSDIPSVPPTTAPTTQSPPTGSIGSNLTISAAESGADPLADSTNPTVDLLLSWYSQGSTDGAANLDHLVNCLRDPRFDVSQLGDFSAVNALRQFSKKNLFPKPKTSLMPGDGWKCGKVTIRVPCMGYKQREEDAPEFTVDGVYYRDIVEVITRELTDPDSFEMIHIKPFEEWWQPTDDRNPVRVYSEIYTSDAMLQFERELKENLKTLSGPQLETFIISVLLYSDATNLTQFSNASLWPMYAYVGNTSKYIRAQPNSFSAHHIAYFPTVWVLSVCSSINHLTVHFQLPDSIKEFYYERYNTHPTTDVLAHLKRELIHGTLRLVFGGSFADAKKNGRVTRCADDVLRHWFLRLVLHSADYMEK